MMSVLKKSFFGNKICECRNARNLYFEIIKCSGDIDKVEVVFQDFCNTCKNPYGKPYTRFYKCTGWE